MYKKNVAGQFIHVQGIDTTNGGIKSAVSWTVRRCIDGTFAAATGTATEDGTTGWYKFAMSQADTNGQNIGFNFTGTGAVPQTVSIVTDGAPPDVNVAKWVTATPNALQSGRVDSYIGAVASGVIVAASFAAGALDAVWSTAARTLTAFSFTNVSANVQQWMGSAPNALQSGRVDSYLGAVASGVIAAASFAAGALDAVWSTTTRTLSAFAFSVTVGTNNDKTGYTASTVTDKTGYALSSGGIQAIWDALTSALTTASSIGKLLVDNINATISSRSTYAGGAVASVTADVGITQAGADKVWGTTARTLSATGVQAVWDAATSALTTSGSVGKRIADNLDVVISTRAGFTIKRNTALSDFKFPMYGSDDHVTPLPGLTVTAERMIDSATTWTACDNTVTEDVNGTYSYDFTAADLNGASILFRFSADGADSQFVTIVTEAA